MSALKHFALASLSCVLVVSSDDPACPGGVCPGLGNLFYLPSTNARKILTGGRTFLNDKSIGSCAKISLAPRSSRKFFEQDSMESFVKTVNTDSSLSGTYPTMSLVAKASVSVLTGSSVDETSHFHSTQLDVTVVTRAVDLMETSACLGSESNFDADYLRRFTALPAITKPEEASSWTPYVNFLRDQGSHMMTQQSIGSRFQQWESTTSSSKDAAKTLKIKACASVEGIGGGKEGWSVEGCSAYNRSQKTSALATSSQSLRLILGGSVETRLALTEEMSEANLDAFIGSAEQGTQAVAYAFKPVWETLITFYTVRCDETGSSTDCENEQRAYNLQAAFEGWLGVECPELKSGNFVYQHFVFSGTSGHSRTYECNAARTGCRSNDDCTLGGAGSVCYCYGPTCLDTGAAVPGTSEHRTTIRGNKHGSYHDGVNNACYYKFIAHCDCHKDWAGGLPDRHLYVQGGASLSSAGGEAELLL